jgi:cytochrome oxidase Cu insertion factor (SCO1/SenC/PrrC family)
LIPTGARGGWLAAAIAVLACACSREPVAALELAAPADSPIVFSEVADFDFVERGSAHLRRADLLGHPWVASFLFTRCTGPCPMVRSTLKKLETRLQGTQALLVTFSVDPAFDTPQVLTEYANAVQADPKRWLFVTGDQAALYALIQKSFLSAVEQAPPGTAPVGEQVSHRTQLVVVDKRGRVRGFYHGESDDELDLLVARLAFLQHEPE